MLLQIYVVLTSQEIRKSHGAGRRLFKDTTIGTPTLLTQFFDEGDLLDKETFVMPGNPKHDPFFFDARYVLFQPH